MKYGDVKLSFPNTKTSIESGSYETACCLGFPDDNPMAGRIFFDDGMIIV